MNVHTVGRLGVEAIFYTSLLFVVAVSTYWPWWKSQLGWSIIAKSLALTLAVMPAMLVIWLGPNSFTESTALAWVAVAGLWAVPVILAWRALVLWRVQVASRPRPPLDDTDPQGRPAIDA